MHGDSVGTQTPSVRRLAPRQVGPLPGLPVPTGSVISKGMGPRATPCPQPFAPGENRSQGPVTRSLLDWVSWSLTS